MALDLGPNLTRLANHNLAIAAEALWTLAAPMPVAYSDIQVGEKPSNTLLPKRMKQQLYYTYNYYIMIKSQVCLERPNHAKDQPFKNDDDLEIFRAPS